MKISGIMPLRNAVKLGYPFELALKSLRLLVDELVVLVDPMSEDDTLARVKALSPDVLVESVWDMTNHQGHTNCEISIQTQKALDAATGDWVFSLQADEILHQREVSILRQLAEHSTKNSIIGLEIIRLYFYGGLHQYRNGWTQWLLRFFKRGHWKPDVDGAMKFDPITEQNQIAFAHKVNIYHYSRVGDPRSIAERIRNLDHFFHDPKNIQSGDLPPYDFSMKTFDTYAIGLEPDQANALLIPFPLDGHPQGVREWFGQ